MNFMARSMAVSVAGLVVFLFATPVSAQSISEAEVTAMANNLGIFECLTSVPLFDFGDVDANGGSHGTPGVIPQGRNPTGTGGRYTNQPGTVMWTCRAAPPSNLQISLASLPSDHTVGTMDHDDLEIRLPSDPPDSWTTGYQLFTSNATLLSSIPAGNGPFEVTGRVELRLTVLDTDPPGPNTWVVRMVVTGSL